MTPEALIRAFLRDRDRESDAPCRVTRDGVVEPTARRDDAP